LSNQSVYATCPIYNYWQEHLWNGETAQVRCIDDTVTDGYVKETIAGWKIRYEPGVFEYEPTLRDILTQDLNWMRDTLPASALHTLRDLRFYVNKDYQYPNPSDSGGSAVVCHWSPIWLSTHGNAAEKQSHVEFYDVKKYVSWRGGQPSIVLHESAHALHWRKMDEKGAEISNTYYAGIADGKYDSVNYIYGGTYEAYAKVNPNEYFAEATEAFFSGTHNGQYYRNDYFPYAKDDLLNFDFGAHELVRELWYEETGKISFVNTHIMHMACVAIYILYYLYHNIKKNVHIFGA